MVSVTLKPLGRVNGRDAVVVFAGMGKLAELDPNVSRVLPRPVVKLLKNHIKHRGFRGRLREVFTIPGTGRTMVFVVGLGSLRKFDLDNFRQASAQSLATLRSLNVQTVDMVVPSFDIPGISFEDRTIALEEGVLLGHYKFDKYKTKPKGFQDVRHVQFRAAEITTSLRKRFGDTQVIIDGTILARDLANDHSDEVYPERFSQHARDIAKKTGLKITILNEDRLQKEGLRLISAVGRGSVYPPRLVILEYHGNKSSDDMTALVGKGITFDTGGVNLKPSQGGMLEDMHLDMSGAAAVLGTMKVVAELKLPVNVLGVMPLAENAISGGAYKPGSIIKAYDGTAVEVENTDAEGRLILADAIGYVVKNYQPTRIIDIATLTGSCMMTFSDVMSGLVSNDEKTTAALVAAGNRTWERVWRLPLIPEYRDMIKGKFGGDINNCGPRPAGAITAGAFLEHFAKKTPWTHIDASSAMQQNSHPYLPKKGTGFGVRLFVDYLMHRD